MRRSGPDGKPHGFDKFVFGNEVGEQVGPIKCAWRTACRRWKPDLHTVTKTTGNQRESEAVEVEGKSAEESGLATGDPGGDRTRDPLIKSQMLYH